MAYGLLAILFALREMSDVFVADYFSWVVIDYAVRLGALGVVCLLVRQHWVAWRDIGLGRVRKDIALAGAMILTALSFVICTICLETFADEPYAGLGMVPSTRDYVFSEFDKWIGLLLVAASEEIVFRGLALSVLKRWGMGAVSTVLISTFVFALAYWSHSVGTIVCFAALGAAFMVTTMTTGSVVPAIVAHYVMMVLLYKG